MTPWHCLLLVYPTVDVRLPAGRFVHEMPADAIDDAVESFRCLPALVGDLTDHAAGIEYEIIRCERALSSLSQWREGCWWPSPDDVAAELDRHAPPGRFDSLFVFWGPNGPRADASIPTGAWGLGMGASAWSRGATYAAVANAARPAWRIPRVGEVWLHEWLHGVCAHFAVRGHRMPEGDADGGDRHGYARSPEAGWTPYYRDLMNGRVREHGRATGIPPAAWNDPFASGPVT